jgi:phosphomannomutase
MSTAAPGDGSGLRFGTAGVRAPLGEGPDRLNDDTVAAIAAGIASWLPPGASVVVGYDARHHSSEFAQVVAHELRIRGVIDVAAGQVPTPVLAFTTRRGDYSAGVMITASHNPAADNGIKVFDGTGAQLDLEQAAEIEAAIDSPRELQPYAELASRTIAPVASYLGALPPVAAGPLKIAYTPLHGVGGAPFLTALGDAGFEDVHVVVEQFEPDPDFATTPFPNPEEAGTLDLLCALVDEVGADIGLAHDPDADRLAVVLGSVVLGAGVLTGDEVGLLLADEVLRGTPGPVATTVVSSSALEVLAGRRGVRYQETLTGFKHLVRAHGGDIAFAYEEALGYAVAPRLVRDKDGISAGLLIASMAAADKAAGRTLRDRLAALETELGVEVATAQVSVRSDDPVRLLESAKHAVPPGFSVLREEPFTVLNQGRRIVIRPSGTEPKLKAYLQASTRAELPELERVAQQWLSTSTDEA